MSSTGYCRVLAVIVLALSADRAPADDERTHGDTEASADSAAGGSRATRIRQLRLRPCSHGAGISTTGPKQTAACGDGQCDAHCGEDYSRCADDCATLFDRVAYLQRRLRSVGFEVDEGTWQIFDPEDCVFLERCWANNPTSPYGYFLLPTAPSEPDPDPERRQPSAPGLRSMWRLQPDEAIVFVFVTPPEVPYFSLTKYAFSRHHPNLSGDPPYGDRVETFASLGDSLNQFVLKTGATAGESPFGQESVVVFTADRGVERAIRAELAESGFPESMVNTFVIPRFDWDGITPFALMGYDNEADLFSMLFRIAHPDAQVEGTPIHDWLSDPEGYVFRARPGGAEPLEPLPKPALRPPGTGVDEDPATLTWLTQKIALRYPDYCSEIDIAQPALNEDGFLCMEWLLPCFADCRDTPYFGANFRLGRAPESIIVAGVNHEMTGKAMYVNITVTRAVDSTAFYSVVMRDLIGSADVYIPDHPGKDTVWQVKFARDCGDEPYCFEVTEAQAPEDALLFVFVRAYLDPATGTSGKVLPFHQSEMVFPRVIKVDCRR